MKKINKRSISKLAIPLPAIEAQVEYVAVADAGRDSVAESEAYVRSLASLRTNLLTALLSGEHEIPSSYDKLLGAIA
jgi:type I restriction enzyme S subunit